MVIPLVFNPGPTATTSERIVGLDRVPSGTHQQTSARVGPVAIASRELSSESECDRQGRRRGPGPVHGPDRRFRRHSAVRLHGAPATSVSPCVDGALPW